MNRILKYVITALVVILIIVYFVFTGGKVLRPCKSYDETLNEGIVEYFSNNLPQTNGEVSKVSIDDLISQGYVSLKVLNKIGNSCEGFAYATKDDGDYYYYNDISCGSCSTDEIYTNWSDWVEKLPNKKNMQVIAAEGYNYSISGIRYGNWSEWLELIKKDSSEEEDTDESIVLKETETKEVYRYREALYKWYKPAGG